MDHHTQSMDIISWYVLIISILVIAFICFIFLYDDIIAALTIIILNDSDNYYIAITVAQCISLRLLLSRLH